MVMVMVMEATLTRPTVACSLGQEGLCAEDGVRGVEERERRRTREWGRTGESVCVCGRGEGRGGGGGGGRG